MQTRSRERSMSLWTKVSTWYKSFIWSCVTGLRCTLESLLRWERQTGLPVSSFSYRSSSLGSTLQHYGALNLNWKVRISVFPVRNFNSVLVFKFAVCCGVKRSQIVVSNYRSKLSGHSINTKNMKIALHLICCYYINPSITGRRFYLKLSLKETEEMNVN